MSSARISTSLKNIIAIDRGSSHAKKKEQDAADQPTSSAVVNTSLSRSVSPNNASQSSHSKSSSNESSDVCSSDSILSSDMSSEDEETKSDVANYFFRSVVVNASSSSSAASSGATDPHVIHARELSRGKKVGSGLTARVYKGTRNDKTIAIKAFKSNKPKRMINQKITFADEAKLKKAEQKFLDEVNIMQKLTELKTPHMVPYHGYTLKPNQIVMDYVPYTLSNYALSSRFHWGYATKLIEQVVTFVKVSHHHKVLHRDLKTNNVLVDDLAAPNAHVSDFGLAVEMTSQEDLVHSCGTPGYVAPEILQKKPASTCTDIYALGGLIWSMAHQGRMMFSQYTPWQSMAWTVQGKREEISSDCPSVVKQIITGCWKSIPDKRYTADQILNLLEHDAELQTQKKSCGLR